MWLLIARWQYFSSVGALCQRRRRESSFLVGWRDLVADLLTDIEAFFCLVFFFNARHGTSRGCEEELSFPEEVWTLWDFYVDLVQRF